MNRRVKETKKFATKEELADFIKEWDADTSDLEIWWSNVSNAFFLQVVE